MKKSLTVCLLILGALGIVFEIRGIYQMFFDFEQVLGRQMTLADYLEFVRANLFLSLIGLVANGIYFYYLAQTIRNFWLARKRSMVASKQKTIGIT